MRSGWPIKSDYFLPFSFPPKGRPFFLEKKMSETYWDWKIKYPPPTPHMCVSPGPPPNPLPPTTPLRKFPCRRWKVEREEGWHRADIFLAREFRKDRKSNFFLGGGSFASCKLIQHTYWINYVSTIILHWKYSAFDSRVQQPTKNYSELQLITIFMPVHLWITIRLDSDVILQKSKPLELEMSKIKVYIIVSSFWRKP